MPVQKDSNIVKIAVQMTDQVPQLIEFNQKQPLAGIIQVQLILIALSRNFIIYKTLQYVYCMPMYLYLILILILILIFYFNYRNCATDGIYLTRNHTRYNFRKITIRITLRRKIGMR